MMELTIDRKVWLHGEGQDRSFLLREPDGKRCCLGIYLAALGIPDESLRGKASPAGIYRALDRATRERIPGWLIGQAYDGTNLNTIIGTCAMEFNDMTEYEITEADREAKIAKIFFEHDVRVTFVGEP